MCWAQQPLLPYFQRADYYRWKSHCGCEFVPEVGVYLRVCEGDAVAIEPSKQVSPERATTSDQLALNGATVSVTSDLRCYCLTGKERKAS